MTKRHKVTTSGHLAKVEPMPPADLLEIAPEEVQEAREALQAANAASREATRAEAAANKERRLAEVPSTIPALDDAVHAAEVEARARLRDAQRAARTLAAALDAHAETMIRDKARRDLERFVQAVDALPALFGFLGGGRTGSSGPARRDLAAHVDPVLQARPDLSTVARALDETDVRGLLERAGWTPEDLDLVEVRSTRGVTILTTESRARTLTSTSGTWTRVNDEEAAK